MMSTKRKFNYYQGANFQMVSVPYTDYSLEMLIVLPSRNVSTNDFVKNLNQAQWNEWDSKMVSKKRQLFLPRFKLEYVTELNDALTALGMGTAFDRNTADFSGMCNTPGYIGKVRHRTFVEVNEKGNEAAATTELGRVKWSGSIGIIDEPFEMIVDHPFFFAIRDRQTGLILFIGYVADPGMS